MRIPPVEVILSWPPPRFDNPETRGPANEIISVILLVLATIILVIRIYTRKCITYGFGWDDILVVLAYIPAAGFVVVGLIAIAHLGWGRHVWDVPADMFPGSLQMGLASEVLFDLATSLTKLSMLALIWRIACEASTYFRFLVIGLEVFISVNCIVFMLVSMLQCRPLSLYWTLSLEPQNCIDESTHLLAAGIINTTTDFIVVLLPLALVRIVHKDKLSSRQMLIVNCLFGAGFLASFAGVARTYFTWMMTTQPDVSWNAWVNWLASTLELFLGIICTSVPSTKPFFNKYLPKLLDSTLHRTQRTTSRAVPTDKGTKGSDMGSQLSAESEPDGPETIPMGSTSAPVAAKRFSDATLNKPLPVVNKKHSVYTINIKLDEGSLSPADRRGRTLNQADASKSQAVRNFSRPKAPHRRSVSEPHSQLRPSTYSTGEGEFSSRIASTSSGGSGSSCNTHILDVENSHRISIDDLEAGIRYGSYESRSSAAPRKKLTGHIKMPSADTFGG